MTKVACQAVILKTHTHMLFDMLWAARLGLLARAAPDSWWAS